MTVYEKENESEFISTSTTLFPKNQLKYIHANKDYFPSSKGYSNTIELNTVIGRLQAWVI